MYRLTSAAFNEGRITGKRRTIRKNSESSSSFSHFHISGQEPLQGIEKGPTVF
jgi:hypothetical protein